MSKFFIDCEFVEGKIPQQILGINIPTWLSNPLPNIQMISIGIVSEDSIPIDSSYPTIKGKTYYAISKDFNLKAAWDNEWIRVNVLRPIFDYWYNLSVYGYYNDNGLTATNDMFTIQEFRVYRNLYGRTNQQIAKDITEFVLPVCNVSPDGIPSYKCSDNTSPEFYGYYSASDWVAFYQLFGKMIDLPKGFPMFAFDIQQQIEEYKIDKEQLLKEIPQVNSHNALQDSIWNYNAYKWIQNKINNGK